MKLRLLFTGYYNFELRERKKIVFIYYIYLFVYLFINFIN